MISQMSKGARRPCKRCCRAGARSTGECSSLPCFSSPRPAVIKMLDKIGIEASKFQARVIMASGVVSRCEWTRLCNSLWDIPHTVRSGWVIVTEKGCVGQGSTGERMVRVLAPSWWGSTDSARHIDTHLPQLPQWPDAVAHCLPTRAGYRNERMPSSRVGG